MASNISTPAITPTPTPGPTAASFQKAPSAPTTKNLRIRQATVQDAEQISQLGIVVFTATFGDSGCTPEQLQKYLDDSYSVAAIRDDLQDPHKTTLVAVDDDDDDDKEDDATTTTTTTTDRSDEKAKSEKVLGFALLNRASSSSEPAIAPYARPVEVQRLYVDTASHGRGIGQALMREAEGLARAEGWAHAWLGVWESNPRAQKVYEKLGYRRVGEHWFDVGGDPQLDWILVKKL